MGQSGEAQLLLLKRIVFFCKEEQSAVIIQRSLYAVCGLFWSKFKNDPFCIRERQKIQNLPEIYICSAKNIMADHGIFFLCLFHNGNSIVFWQIINTVFKEGTKIEH